LGQPRCAGQAPAQPGAKGELMAARTASPSYRAATERRTLRRDRFPGPSLGDAGPTRSPGRAQDDRRTQMLRAALEVLAERGFSRDEDRRRGGRQAAVSPALVIYYFKTKNHLLTEAMRYAEDVWYEQGARRNGGHPAVRPAASREIVAMSCLPQRRTTWCRG